jgi:hypothetical protein
MSRYLLYSGYLEFRHLFTLALVYNLAVVPTCLAPGLLRDAQEAGCWLLACSRQAKPGLDFPAAEPAACCFCFVLSVSTEVSIYNRLVCLMSNINTLINVTM